MHIHTLYGGQVWNNLKDGSDMPAVHTIADNRDGPRQWCPHREARGLPRGAWAAVLDEECRRLLEHGERVQLDLVDMTPVHAEGIHLPRAPRISGVAIQQPPPVSARSPGLGGGAVKAWRLPW